MLIFNSLIRFFLVVICKAVNLVQSGNVYHNFWKIAEENQVTNLPSIKMYLSKTPIFSTQTYKLMGILTGKTFTQQQHNSGGHNF